MCGLSLEEFDALFAQVADLLPERQTIDKPSQLLLGLVFLRQYPTENMLAMLFRVTEGVARETYHGVVEILFEALNNEIHWPTDTEFEEIKRTMRHLVTEHFPDVVAIVDGVEVRVQRSRDPKVQEAEYSGKKGYHTLQWQIVVLPDGFIVDVSQVFPGRPNDKAKYDFTNLWAKFEGERKKALMADLGYKGGAKQPKNGEIAVASEIQLEIPTKKRRQKKEKRKKREDVPTEKLLTDPKIQEAKRQRTQGAARGTRPGQRRKEGPAHPPPGRRRSETERRIPTPTYRRGTGEKRPIGENPRCRRECHLLGEALVCGEGSTARALLLEGWESEIRPEDVPGRGMPDEFPHEKRTIAKIALQAQEDQRGGRAREEPPRRGHF